MMPFSRMNCSIAAGLWIDDEFARHPAHILEVMPANGE